MKKLHSYIVPLFIVILFDWMMSMVSCKKTEDDPCDYKTVIKPIIAAKCSIQACHDANSTVAKFTIDSVVKSKADAGKIQSRVFELKIMPPPKYPQLTDEEKNKLKCWLDNGAALD